jgi:hypothetical protein
VIALKRLAQETAEIYDELIRCKTPPQLVRGYFLVSMLRERIVEERRGERLRSAALESFTRMPTRRPSTNYRILTGVASSFRLQSGTSLRVPDRGPS